ncbi:WbqC family protein [Legionella yabuuchiae]|uniref:WbqC family protein n=1 Tax=Legionella yabuuchiae TaxID=376727 RepID=UPI00105443FC|nr:WbqC family protein [Legionella yabuuchiae]
MTICAIHQPNFFPWCGYFDKIKRADVFIFLDEVAYPKSGSGAGSWCNRVKLLNSGKPTWYGLPIQRESGVQLINTITFTNKEYHLKKIVKTLEHNYKKAKYYQETYPLIESLLHYPAANLAEYNIHAITQLASFLGLKTQFVRQSELSHSNCSTELLIELVKQVKADTYLSGNGSMGYLQEALLGQAGIKLIYQDAEPVKNFINITSDEEQSFSILHLLMMHYGDFL